MIRPEQITLYWDNAYRPALREEADKITEKIQVHSREVLPEKLLTRKRPNELQQHREYRKDVYEAFTYGWFQKVMTQFEKIRRAEDWSITFPDKVGENLLQAYTEKNFPEYDSLENWLFTFQMQRIIDDPNCIILWAPKNLEALLDAEETLRAGERFQPVAFLYESAEVVEFVENELLVIQRTHIRADKTEQKEMLFFDREEIVRLRDNPGTQPDERASYRHGLGWLTAYAGGGLVKSGGKKTGVRLYNSFISAAIPFWNKAIEGESDHDVDKALHLHPDRWVYASAKCKAPHCKDGTMYDPRARAGQQQRTCPDCKGTGYTRSVSPFGEHVVNFERTGMNQGQLPPMPPAGYIQRPTATIELNKKLADAKIYDGLAAINLEHLASVSMNQSGRAKEFDRQEIDTYVGQIAAHLVTNILRPAYFYINLWLQPEKNDRERYEPRVNVPKKFDLITADIWLQRVESYGKGGSSAAKARAEKKLAEKTYGADAVEYFYIRDAIDLDPLYGMDPAIKVEAVMNGGCSKSDYIISTKINSFIRRAAIETQEKFFGEEYAVKVKRLEGYAKETITASASEGVNYEFQQEKEKEGAK